MTKPRAAHELSRREQEVLAEIRHWAGGPSGFVESIVVEARPACVRLIQLGLITEETVRGPRGATSWRYRTTEEGLRR